MKDTTLILLAGGNGTRTGFIGKCLSKSLLLTYDEPLILRQIRQAHEAGVKNIIISTNAKFYGLFVDIIGAMRAKDRKIKIVVQKNHGHRFGSLPALLQSMKTIKTEKTLLGFPDLYYFENPYTVLNRFKAKDNRIITLTAKPYDQRELSFGSIAFCNDRNRTSLVERPLKGNKKGTRWAGLTLFNSSLAIELKNFLSEHRKNSPEDDFFDFCRNKDIPIVSTKGPDFINVNTLDDLFLVSCCRSVESGSFPLPLVKQIQVIIPTIRKLLIHKKAVQTYASHLLSSK